MEDFENVKDPETRARHLPNTQPTPTQQTHTNAPNTQNPHPTPIQHPSNTHLLPTQHSPNFNPPKPNPSPAHLEPDLAHSFPLPMNAPYLTKPHQAHPATGVWSSWPPASRAIGRSSPPRLGRTVPHAIGRSSRRRRLRDAPQRHRAGSAGLAALRAARPWPGSGGRTAGPRRPTQWDDDPKLPCGQV